MIFICLGNHNQPFTRLLSWASRVAESGILPDELVVQAGHDATAHPDIRVVGFMTSAAFDDHVLRARALVTHAGQGTIFAGLAAGLTPVVVPRLKRLGEHTNDHQLQIAQEFERYGLVRVAQTYEEFVAHLNEVVALPRREARPLHATPAMLTQVTDFLNTVITLKR